MKKEETAEEVPAKELAAPDEAEVYHGVLVVREIDENGNISCRTIPTGDVKATEIETILKLGLKFWQSQIGV